MSVVNTGVFERLRHPFVALALAGLLGGPFAVSLAQEGESASSRPVAVPVEPILDAGVVAKGEWIHHTFEIRNDGEALLELTAVKPSCGCTVAEYDARIEPGKTGRIDVKLETANLSGLIAKSIAVFTNDSEAPKLELVVKADVKPYLGVRPGYARYIYVRGEPIEPIAQLMWAEDGFDLEIVEVRSPYDFLKVEHRVATAEERHPEHPGKQWAFEFHLDPLAPIGALRKYVEVIVEHPKQKSVRIPVSGFIRPRQHVTPAELDVGRIERDQLPAKRLLALTNFIEAAIEVHKAETDHEGLTVEVREAGRMDGHRFEVVVTVEPEMPEGPFTGTLKLQISDPKNPLLEVPMTGEIL